MNKLSPPQTVSHLVKPETIHNGNMYSPNKIYCDTALGSVGIKVREQTSSKWLIQKI